MQPIEGITPDMLWTFILVLAGLGALIVLGDKVLDVWRKYKARKAIKDGPEGQLAENISKRILAELEPRLQGIEEKLKNDNRRLDIQSQQIAVLEANNADGKEARKIILSTCRALASHEINGNSVDKLSAALASIDNYLINR